MSIAGDVEILKDILFSAAAPHPGSAPRTIRVYDVENDEYVLEEVGAQEVEHFLDCICDFLKAA